MWRGLLARGLAAITRRWHGLPGRWRLVRWLEGQSAVFARLSPRVVCLAPGFAIQVDPVDENGRHIYIHGFDRRERLTRQLLRLLRPGDNVLDIGANCGYFAQLAARCVGPVGRVYAFEPSLQSLPGLDANARLSADRNIVVCPRAVTDYSGEIEFYAAPADRTGYSSIRRLSDAVSTTRVPCVTIDSLLAGLPPMRLVKIDVEGAELRVLHGMEELLARDHPYVIFELDDGFLRELGADAQQPCDWLSAHGYRLRRIVTGGKLRAIHQAPTERCNVLAEPVAAAVTSSLEELSAD